MLAIVLRIATAVLGGGVVSWISSNLAVIGIAGVLLLVTNVAGGFIWYIKGHNSAAAKCNLNSIIQERDQLKRDVSIANRTATDTSAKLTELQGREAARAQREADDATKDKPIAGCVIDDPLPSPRRLRNRDRR